MSLNQHGMPIWLDMSCDALEGLIAICKVKKLDCTNTERLLQKIRDALSSAPMGGSEK